jgi:predicted KAP-like P-loop ATPase
MLKKKRLKLQEVELKLSPGKQIPNEQNEYINAKVEKPTELQLNTLRKYQKHKSDQYTALSNQFDTEAQVKKKTRKSIRQLQHQKRYVLYKSTSKRLCKSCVAV